MKVLVLILALIGLPAAGRGFDHGAAQFPAGARAGGNAGKRIVVCIDGTWNSPYKMKPRFDETKVIKPTNVLKTCRAVEKLARDERSQLTYSQLTYYDIGVGALNKHPGYTNKLLRGVDSTLGGIWGAGFETRVEDAYRFLVHNYVEGDQIFVFGFSRGAGVARSLTRFIDWMEGIPTKGDAYYIPMFFSEYERTRGDRKLISEKVRKKRGQLDPFLRAKVEFLGVWETVLALGSRVKANDGTTVRKRSFHARWRSPAPIVQTARQALAIDERRYDFRPEIWLRPAGPHQSLEQRWFAGVHSNVGGGYVHDGAANRALFWILNEAREAGLEIDCGFLAAYQPPGYSMDALYDSRRTFYKVREFVLGGRTKGPRDLRLDPLAIDKAALRTLAADERRDDGSCDPDACERTFEEKYEQHSGERYEDLPSGKQEKIRDTCCARIDPRDAGLSIDEGVFVRLRADPREQKTSCTEECSREPCGERFRDRCMARAKEEYEQRSGKSFERLPKSKRDRIREDCCLAHPELDLYRPENLLRYLSHCSGTPVPEEARNDVMPMREWLDTISTDCLFQASQPNPCSR